MLEKSFLSYSSYIYISYGTVSSIWSCLISPRLFNRCRAVTEGGSALLSKCAYVIYTLLALLQQFAASADMIEYTL